MTIEHAGPFLESSVFSGNRAWVCFVLYNHADDEGYCWPSYYTIASSARCNRSTAIRQVSWLAEHGVVKILQGDDRPKNLAPQAGRANVFLVNTQFPWALGQLMRGVKSAAGRSPKDRSGAVRTIADWAEVVIGEHGVETLIEAVNFIIRNEDYFSLLESVKGGKAPLLRKDNSGNLRLSRVAISRENGRQESHHVQPKPSIDSSIEPSPPDAGDWAGENRDGGEGAQAPDSDLVRRAKHKVLIEWLRVGAVDRYNAIVFARIDHGGLDGERARDFVLRLDPYAVKKVASWAAWALDLHSGRPDMEAPIEPVRKILTALEHLHNGVHVENRCNELIARADALKANCRDPP